MSRREKRIETIFKLYLYDLLEVKEDSEDNDLFNKVLENLEHIDEVISNVIKGYTLSRLSYLDRAIIRLATYEIIYTNTPKEIIINEAIEITKKYSDIDDKQRRFNNRLLEKIKESLD